MKIPTKPHFYGTEPKHVYSINKRIKIIELFDNEEVQIPELEPGQHIRFVVGWGMYDAPDNYYWEIYRVEETINVNYEKEITEYNKLKADYDKRMKVYNTAMDAYRAEQLKEQDKKELAEYERLKSKFGPK